MTPLMKLMQACHNFTLSLYNEHTRGFANWIDKKYPGQFESLQNEVQEVVTNQDGILFFTDEYKNLTSKWIREFHEDTGKDYSHYFKEQLKLEREIG